MFKDNLEYINKHNEEAAQGKHTFTLGVNKFADITHTEWQNSLNVRKIVKDTYPAPVTMRTKARADSKDWRDDVSGFIKLFDLLLTMFMIKLVYNSLQKSLTLQFF